MNKVISLMGPTASGKTDLAILLAQEFNLEIISVDSVMFYKEFNIGSAKPKEEILAKFPHRMINILEPFEEYSVAKFYENLLLHIKEVHNKKKIPLLVGGSMMYFKTYFSGGLSDLKIVQNDIKKLIDDMLSKNNLEFLYDYLKKIDIEFAKKIHFNDKYRIVRGLEIYFSNKKKPSEIINYNLKEKKFFKNLNLSVIPNSRDNLHKNIEIRLDNMLAEGLLDEVNKLNFKYVGKKLPAMSTIGYKQANEFLQGKMNVKTMRSNILAATRQLAKRQITWLRHIDATIVYELLVYDNILIRVDKFVRKKI